MKQASSGWEARWTKLVNAIRVVHTPEDEGKLMRDLAQSDAPCVLAFVNAHAMNCAASEERFASALGAADILLRDGSGMDMLYRRCGRDGGLNMNGTDFIPKAMAAWRGRRIALWGTTEPYLSRAASVCEKAYGLKVVGTVDGFHDDAVYVEFARQLRPEVIVLGMGMPKQERVASAIRDARIPSVIVCGGAILDFLGGKVQRAPVIMRRLGMEWVYRLFREPLRLFDRYVIGNALFLLRLRAWQADGSFAEAFALEEESTAVNS